MTDLTDDDEARAIKERRAKITPGEWFADGNEVRVNVYPGVPDGSTSQDIDIAIACYRPNRDFIAHAPTDIARLLSAREQDRKEIERLKEEAHSLEAQMDSLLSATEIVQMENRRLKAELDLYVAGRRP